MSYSNVGSASETYHYRHSLISGATDATDMFSCFLKEGPREALVLRPVRFSQGGEVTRRQTKVVSHTSTTPDSEWQTVDR